MTPEQYEILKEVHESNIRMEVQLRHVEQANNNQKESILQLAKEHFALEHKVSADRNKVLGAIGVLASSVFLGIVSFIISLFYNGK